MENESEEHNGIYCNLLPLTCGLKKLFIEHQLRIFRFFLRVVGMWTTIRVLDEGRLFG